MHLRHTSDRERRGSPQLQQQQAAVDAALREQQRSHEAEVARVVRRQNRRRSQELDAAAAAGAAIFSRTMRSSRGNNPLLSASRITDATVASDMLVGDGDDDSEHRGGARADESLVRASAGSRTSLQSTVRGDGDSSDAEGSGNSWGGSIAAAETEEQLRQRAVDDLQTVLRAKEARIAALSAQLDASRDAETAACEALKRTTARCNQLAQDVESMAQTVSASDTDRERALAAAASLNAELQRVSAEHASTVERLKLNAAELEQRFTEIGLRRDEELQQARGAYDAAMLRVQEVEERAAQASAETAQCQEESETCRALMHDAEERAALATEDAATARHEASLDREAAAAARASLEAAEEERDAAVQAATAAREAAARVRDEAAAVRAGLKNDVDAAQRRIAELEEGAEARERHTSRLLMTAAAAKDECSALRTELASAHAALRAAREDAAAARSAHAQASEAHHAAQREATCGVMEAEDLRSALVHAQASLRQERLSFRRCQESAHSARLAAAADARRDGAKEGASLALQHVASTMAATVEQYSSTVAQLQQRVLTASEHVQAVRLALATTTAKHKRELQETERQSGQQAQAWAQHVASLELKHEDQVKELEAEHEREVQLLMSQIRTAHLQATEQERSRASLDRAATTTLASSIEATRGHVLRLSTGSLQLHRRLAVTMSPPRNHMMRQSREEALEAIRHGLVPAPPPDDSGGEGSQPPGGGGGIDGDSQPVTPAVESTDAAVQLVKLAEEAAAIQGVLVDEMRRVSDELATETQAHARTKEQLEVASHRLSQAQEREAALERHVVDAQHAASRSVEQTSMAREDVASYAAALWNELQVANRSAAEAAAAESSARSSTAGFVATLQQKLRESREHAADASAELRTVKGELAASQTVAQDLEDEVAGLKHELSAARDALQQANAEGEELEQAIAQASAARQSVEAARAMYEDARAQLLRSHEEGHKLKRELAESQATVADLRTELDTWRQRCATTRDDLLAVSSRAEKARVALGRQHAAELDYAANKAQRNAEAAQERHAQALAKAESRVRAAEAAAAAAEARAQAAEEAEAQRLHLDVLARGTLEEQAQRLAKFEADAVTRAEKRGHDLQEQARAQARRASLEVNRVRTECTAAVQAAQLGETAAREELQLLHRVVDQLREQVSDMKSAHQDLTVEVSACLAAQEQHVQQSSASLMTAVISATRREAERKLLLQRRRDTRVRSEADRLRCCCLVS